MRHRRLIISRTDRLTDLTELSRLTDDRTHRLTDSPSGRLRLTTPDRRPPTPVRGPNLARG